MKKLFSIFSRKKKKPYYRFHNGKLLRLDLQYFASDDEEDDDDEEEPETKKKGESTPEWAKKLQTSLDKLIPTKEEKQEIEEVPVPPAPKEEDEDEEEEAPKETLGKKLLNYLF
jgi:hypothetical protein